MTWPKFRKWWLNCKRIWNEKPCYPQSIERKQV